ncbi:MAG: hypothetical protein ACRDNW_00770 [Trebonia sp.]
MSRSYPCDPARTECVRASLPAAARLTLSGGKSASGDDEVAQARRGAEWLIG